MMVAGIVELSSMGCFSWLGLFGAGYPWTHAVVQGLVQNIVSGRSIIYDLYL